MLRFGVAAGDGARSSEGVLRCLLEDHELGLGWAGCWTRLESSQKTAPREWSHLGTEVELGGAEQISWAAFHND